MVQFSRRNFLGAVGVGAGGMAAGPVLAGCTDNSGPTSGGDFEIPTYQPAPDLEVTPLHASETPGMENIYDQFPERFFKSVEREPGSGATVTTFQLLWGDPPKGLDDDNAYWEELNERLGVNYDPQFVPQPTFTENFSTMLASGEVPDLVFVNDQDAVNLQGIRDGAFADLSEFLSGDNILQWPNLAAREEHIWRASLKGGRLYQIPSPAWALTNLPVMRTDLVDETSIGREPSDADELFTMLKEVSELGTGPGGQQVYGFGWFGQDSILWRRLFRVGPDWQLDDSGKLVHATETENYREMLIWLARAWEEGIFDPNAMTANEGEITSGAALSYEAVTNTIGIEGFALMENDLPGAKYDFFAMPGFDGTSQLVVRNIPYGKSTCVSAAAAEDEDHLVEVLNVLDYLSAPFGSEEHLFVQYGQEGRHYDFGEDGVPQRIGDHADELGVQYVGVTSGDNAYHLHSSNRDWAESFAETMERMAENSIVRDLEGFETESATFVAQGAQFKQQWDDFERGVVTGRESVDDLDSFISNFMSQGGEQIRTEYTEVLDAQ